MKKPLLLLFSLFIAQQICAQNDFRPGYVITTKGDTINGFVNYKVGLKKFEVCNYKKSKEEKDPVNYFPNQIHGYGFVGDRFFEAKEITAEESKKVFIEVLVKGKATLYRYNSDFFIEKNDSIFKQLVNEVSIEYTELGYREKQSNRHIGVLTYLFSDCPKVKKKAQTVQLKEKALVNLTKAYNDCFNEPSIVFLEDKPWIKANVGLSPGTNFSSLTIDEAIENEDLGFFSSDLGNATAFSIGAFVDISVPRINDRISIHTAVQYVSANFEGSRTRSNRFFNFSYETTTELEQLRIPVGIKYTFPEKKVTPYFAVGVMNNINLKTNTVSVVERERIVNNSIQNFEESTDLDTTIPGFWAGIGIKKTIKNTLNGFLELRFERSTGFVGEERFQRQFRYELQNFQLSIGLSL
ncbi:MAG: hypothetical protein AAFO07_24385 [Bacteroidota bacterium]